MNKKFSTAVWFILLPALAYAWVDPNALQSDPVLELYYPQARIAFEKAPPLLVNACTEPDFGTMWIFAETARPEGDYMLVSGTIWVEKDSPYGPHKPVLEEYGHGEIILVRQDGSCRGVWDADNAFGSFFPNEADDKPSVAEAAIVRDLGIDLIRRAERALGGRSAFLAALDATGTKDSQQDAVMIPLIEAERKGSLE